MSNREVISRHLFSWQTFWSSCSIWRQHWLSKAFHLAFSNLLSAKMMLELASKQIAAWPNQWSLFTLKMPQSGTLRSLQVRVHLRMVGRVTSWHVMTGASIKWNEWNARSHTSPSLASVAHSNFGWYKVLVENCHLLMQLSRHVKVMMDT